MTQEPLNAEQLLDFWFSDRVAKLWFRSTPEFDQELRDKFLLTYQLACDGQLDHWQHTVNGALALVIIFDQLPLNMFRGKPESFSTESRSRDVAAYAIEKGFDQHMADKQKAFLYMPFMHSENLADQQRSIELFEKAGLQDNLRFAHHHHDIVKRYGRFPHRNRILGRQSSQQELDYLASKEAFLG
jgi:uncharacterized protein (DUF924 family)